MKNVKHTFSAYCNCYRHVTIAKDNSSLLYLIWYGVNTRLRLLPDFVPPMILDAAIEKPYILESYIFCYIVRLGSDNVGTTSNNRHGCNRNPTAVTLPRHGCFQTLLLRNTIAKNYHHRLLFALTWIKLDTY